MSSHPFQLDVPAATLDDLAARLARTRLAPGPPASDWEAGTSPLYLAELLEHWRTTYDWRAQQAKLNALPQFRAQINGHWLHFVHQRSRVKRALPLLLTHGYPDSFWRFHKLIPLLTDPAAHGGDEADAFDVVAPSLPGFGPSQKPERKGLTFQFGTILHELMVKELGYQKFGAHGGDWGSTITEQLARSHGGSLVGVHLTDVPFAHTLQPPDDLIESEKRFLAKVQAFSRTEGAYIMIQGTRPQTLADALDDSPLGLAAWIIEKFYAWSDCDGDLETRFSKDELLTNVMLYWVTQSIGTSFLPYADMTNATPVRWMVEKAKELVGSARVPAGFAIFPKDIVPAPREWAERFFNVQRWTELPRGGHFAALEEPQLLAEELRAFFRPLRAPPAST